MVVLILCMVGAAAAAVWAADSGNQSAWVKHEDATGFVLEHPPGWTVAKTEFDAIVVRSPEKTTFAVILPFTMDGPGSSQNAINTLPRILLAPQLPGAAIGRVKQLSERPDLAIAEVAFNSDGDHCRGNLMCLILGKTGTLYGIAAPQGVFAEWKPTLVRILNSFSFAQPDKATVEQEPAESLEFVTWRDPREDAFALQVPTGWSVSGGTFRHSPTDPRPAVAMESPEKDAAVFIGSGEFPTYVLPTPMDVQLGLAEGSAALGGMVRLRYLTGAQAAQMVITNKLSQAGFTDVKIVDTEDYQDLAQLATAALQQQGMQGCSQSFGSISFTGKQSGKETRGFCFAGTQYSQLIWSINYLIGYVAEEGKEQIAEAVMYKTNVSVQWNMQWQAGNQAAMAAQIQNHPSSSSSANTSGSDVSDMLYESYKRRNQADDEMARNRSNATMGQTDVRNADTGQTGKAEAGYNYYWQQGGTNEIYGTQGPDRPANNIDFTPLEEY